MDDGIGFMAENHSGIIREEEMMNVTLPPDTVANESLSFRDEKHEGIEKHEVSCKLILKFRWKNDK